MSVTSMARLASGNEETSTTTTFKNALSLVAAYIPSEALAIYLATMGLLIPATSANAEQIFRIRIVCFLVGFGVALFLAYVGFERGDLSQVESRRRRIVVMAFAGLAFIIYSAATPLFFLSDLNFLTISWTQWAAVVAIVAASVLPYFAKALNIRT